jgi:serine/threonine-protein kinase HipA
MPAPGTSLGGARPKASLRERGELLIAKFPKRDDEWPVTRWEALALALARTAKIDVPESRLQLVAKRPVLLLRRFDRRASERIPFMSAMTAAGAGDNEPRSYPDIVDALRRNGSQVAADLEQLRRRLAINVLVSNTDDHLRNHGLLHDGVGWRLAPAYDLNPTPLDVKPRVHALALDESDTTGSLEVAFASAPRFGIASARSRTIACEVAASVRAWRKVGAELGLKATELERMASAFEHGDLALAGA